MSSKAGSEMLKYLTDMTITTNWILIPIIFISGYKPQPHLQYTGCAFFPEGTAVAMKLKQGLAFFI
jgi:hypothetical protein